MSEAVTVPSLMMISIVSEDSLARDTHTHTHTHTRTRTRTHTPVVYVKMCKIAFDFFANKNYNFSLEINNRTYFIECAKCQ